MPRGRIVEDMTGKIYGCWEVIERDFNPTSKSHETFWKSKCLTCGNIASVRKTDLKKEPRSCNNCKGEIITQILLDKGMSVHPIKIGEIYGLLEIIEKPYSKNNRAYVKCKCECGNIIEVRKDHLLGLNHSRTISCGCSRVYSGELKIKQLLEQYNIDFVEQLRLREYNYSAPFDFGIYENNKLIKIIEYDGEGHYKSIEAWGGEEKLKLQQERDERKNQWCKENNINLLRIPYWDYNNINIEYLFPNFPELN